MIIRYAINFLLIAPITLVFRLVNHEQNTDYLSVVSILAFNEIVIIILASRLFKAEPTDALDEVPHSSIIYKDKNNNFALQVDVKKVTKSFKKMKDEDLAKMIKKEFKGAGGKKVKKTIGSLYSNITFKSDKREK